MLIQILILAAGFVLLVKGADWFVDGASAIAEKLRIPPLIIGLTIVAMGTSAPEAAVSICGAEGKRRHYDRKHCGQQYFEHSNNPGSFCRDCSSGGGAEYDPPGYAFSAGNQPAADRAGVGRLYYSF